MAKKINYAEVYGFTLRSDGRYCKKVTIDNVPKFIYDRDPEALFHKWQAVTKPQPKQFKDVAEAWKEKHWEEIANGTKVCYNPAYNRAVAEFGDIPINEVLASDVNRLILMLSTSGKSKKVVSTQRTVLKMIFDYAIICNFIQINPVASVSIPVGLPKETREAPEDDIIEIIRKSADKHFGLYVFFLLYTGFRRSEALAITWGDIDFKKKTIRCAKAVEYSGGGKPRIKTPKTKAGIRTVPLLADLENVLIKPKDAKDTDYIFAGADGGVMKDSAFRRAWKHYCKEAGLCEVASETRKDKRGREYLFYDYQPTLTAHQLRHGYATILFEAGVDVYSAKELLGHANIETTMAIYTHLRQKQRGKAAEMLNEHFAKTYTIL